ncbi:hypothetical protein [Longirhabdus pacifica]|uniref:hypothetical protein n=1 Tax=Longirhabdus pacifica TaxID=2305227 RepID=UPI0010091805|nr:hypothetical protein [Longirhabdus pacifica]
MNQWLKGWLLFCAVVLVVIYPVYQIWDLVQENKQKQYSEKMLYQVSLLQMDWLYRHLQETSQALNSQQLDHLKQAIYMANFTHERFSRAVGSGNVTTLPSLSHMMDFVLRMQMSGHTQLKESEVDAFQKMTETYGALLLVYEQLYASNGEILRSQNDQLNEYDNQISSLLSQLWFDS